MADLRFPVMADISYDRGRRQPERGAEFAHRRAFARSLKLERQKATLLGAVEFEIVPRLLSAHQVPATHARPTETPDSADAITRLTAFALGRNEMACGPYIQSLLDQKLPLEQIYLEIVEPAARRLMQMWTEDERAYADVTLGLWRLQQLLRDFGAVFRQPATMPSGQSVLLTLPPGETHELPYHMFMLVLSGEFLRRDGWNTWIEPDCNRRDAMTLIRSEWFDVVEFLVSSEKRLDLLVMQIKTIRAEAVNRTLCIALAGKTAHQHPELLKFLGADVLAAGPERECR